MAGQETLVLFVEDNEDVIDLVMRAFDRHPTAFRIDVARSLTEARNYLKESAYDIAIVDLVLPDGSGSALLHEGDADWTTPFLFTSGDSDISHDVLRETTEGVLGVVVKTADNLRKLPAVVGQSLVGWQQFIGTQKLVQALPAEPSTHESEME